MDPLLRFYKHKRIPRSAERGQRLCLWTPPPLKRRAKLLFALRAAKGKSAEFEHAVIQLIIEALLR